MFRCADRLLFGGHEADQCLRARLAASVILMSSRRNVPTKLSATGVQ